MKKKINLLWIVLVSAALLVFGLFYFRSHELNNESKRQQFIAHTWNHVEKSIHDKSNLYLDSNKQLTAQGQEFIKKSVHESLQQKVGISQSSDLLMLEYLITQGLLASFNVLEWCDCIHPDKRIDLVFQMVRDVKAAYPDSSQELQYVSLGSGDLLQDFIAIAGLINQGYCRLKVVIIDFKYRDAISFSKFVKNKESKKVAHTINTFKSHVAAHIADKPQCSIQIEPFISAYEYIDAVKSGSRKKADILVMADPNRLLSLFKVDTLAEANLFELSGNELLVIMPEFHKPRLYLPLDSSKVNLEKALEEVRKIVNAVTDNNYRDHLKKELDHFDVNYYAEPFITFQDLIRHITHPKSLVYGLYEVPGKTDDVVDRIDVYTYPDKDVISVHVGKDLTQRGEDFRRYQEIAL